MIKVAFVGCGRAQEVHSRHLEKMPEVKMVGHCDLDRPRAEAWAARHGGEAFVEFEAMYDKVKPDVAYVAVPPFAHGAVEEAAAERGIHLFIEKPIAIDRKTAKRVAAAIRKADILCSVGYCYRYCDTIAMARELLKGKPTSLIMGACSRGVPETGWRRRMDKSGGQIVEHTTHLFDLVRYLSGEVAEVYAVCSTGCMTKLKDFTLHDSSSVSFRLKNGAVGTVASSCIASHPGSIWLELVTPAATLCFRDGVLVVKEDGKITKHAPRTDMYAEEDAAFVEAVRSGKRNGVKSCYADALKTFLVTAAINESAVSGMPVKL